MCYPTSLDTNVIFHAKKEIKSVIYLYIVFGMHIFLVRMHRTQIFMWAWLTTPVL